MDYIPFSEIVTEIRRLCAQRATGALFVATKANRSAQIALDNGNIVYVYFYNKRGLEAVTLMSTIGAGRFRFQEGAVVARQDNLPGTGVILDALERATMASAGVMPAASPKPAAAPVQAGGAAAPAQLAPGEQELLEKCLAEFIGPMAALVCEDHLQGSIDFTAAVEALAAEIPTPGQAEKFRELVRQRSA